MSAKTSLSAVQNYVAIDTETTGLDTSWCELIEVSAVRYSNGNIVDSFSSLIKPNELPIDEFITDLTGITSEELEDAPYPSEVIPAFADFIGNSPVVGHNVCFDAKFISKYFDAILSKSFDNMLIDTLRISRHVFKDMKKRKLNLLVERCIEDANPFDGVTNAHRAKEDAIATAFCYESMKQRIVELYGDDPDEGYRKYRASHSERNAIDYDGVTPTVEVIDESNPFFGSSICFTGTLSGMTRREAVQHAVNLGAEPQKGVTKKLDYLVVGSFEFNASLSGKKSSKLKKAETYIKEGTGLQIVSDNFFLSYV